MTSNIAFDRSKFEIKWIPVKNLSVIWRESQRDFNERDAQKIADNFDPELFGHLVGTLPNGNGIHHLMDGQHRKAAVQSMWGDEEKVPVQIIPLVDPKRAAEMFDKINTCRRPVPPIEKFKVRVKADYEVQTAITKICDKLGYKIRKVKSDGDIQAVGALENIYRSYGPECLKNALTLIQGTWGMDQNSVSSPIIAGFGSFTAEYGNKANWQRLTDRTAKSYTPGRLIGAARSYRELHRISMTQAINQMLVAIYNRGLKTGKLES